MEVSSLVSALGPPPEDNYTELQLQWVDVAVPVVFLQARTDGILLSLPTGLIGLEELHAAAIADDAAGHALVGAFFEHYVPARGRENVLLGVTLIDFHNRVLSLLTRGSEFAFTDEGDWPSAAGLAEALELFIGSAEIEALTQGPLPAGLPLADAQAAAHSASDGHGYATGDDLAQPWSAPLFPSSATAKRRAAPVGQRLTVTQLASQVQPLIDLAPSLTRLLERLEALEARSSAAPAQAPAPGSQAVRSPLQPSFAPPALPGSTAAPLFPSTSRNLLQLGAQMLPPAPSRSTPLPGPAQPMIHRRSGGGVADDDELPGGLHGTLLQNLALQSEALKTLLQHRSGDDSLMGDLGTSGVSSSTSIRGAMGREKLQQLMGEKPGTIGARVAIAMQRRLGTAPSDQNSSCALRYLERFGGYNHCRDLGYVAWMQAHVFNATQRGDLEAAKDYAALALMATDQAARDGGKWDVAWAMSLFQDPPAQIFAPLPACATSSPFTSLADPSMAVIALAYLKEIDAMSTRRAELGQSTRQRPPGKQPTSPPSSVIPPASEAPGETGYLRRRPRGKAKASAAP